jgi:ABC-2 type transport system permease protein
MTLWHLEILRLTRTRRVIALFGVYVFFGVVGPLTARYLADIVGLAGGELEGATIEFPPPTPPDGMIQYTSNAAQIGTLVAVVVAAGALAFDSIPEMGVFLRTRVRDLTQILVPRFVVVTAAIVSAFTAGALAAWYETWALIGALDAGPVLIGIGYGALFVFFVVALVTGVAGWARSVLSTVMTSIVVLLVLPLIGIADAVGRWLPTRLASALAELPAGATTAGDYLEASIVAVAAIAGLVWLGLVGARRREL